MGRTRITPSSRQSYNFHPCHDSLLASEQGISKGSPVRNAGDKRKRMMQGLASNWRPRRCRRVSTLPFRLSLDANSSHNSPSVGAVRPPCCMEENAASNTATFQCRNGIMVMPIPGYSNCSSCGKQPLNWTEAGAFSQTEENSFVDFASEGWDWHHVMDDEIAAASSNEYLHPLWPEDDVQEESEEAMAVDSEGGEPPKLTRSHRFVANLEGLEGGMVHALCYK